MKLIDVNHIKTIIKNVGLTNLFDMVITRIEYDYKNWDKFIKSPRHATHSKTGVIELMPISDDEFYGFKYVNGHPINTKYNKLSVMALGMLASVIDGAPILMCEMTLLTAIRTASASAVAAKYCARNDSEVLGIIGAGAQAEFQVIALTRIFKFKEILAFDIDSKSLSTTKQNLAKLGIDLSIANSIGEVVSKSDILTTATAAKKNEILFNADLVPPGCHINAIGGDCPGKTELDINQFINSHIVVEYLPQAQIEGEIQNLSINLPVSELHDVITKKIIPRKDDLAITIFDSVGFALEDYSILRVINDLAVDDSFFSFGKFIPEVEDPKNLISCIMDVL